MSKATPFNGLRNAVAALMRLMDGKADKDKVVSSVNGQTGAVTVEVPALPDNIVQSVNGTGPDAEGNVQVQVGVTSWNDLQDKPFYDTATMEEWNGDATEKHCVFVQGDETNGMGFVRVSEKAYTQDELREAQVIALDSQGGEYSWKYMSAQHDGTTDIILNGSDSTADPIMLIAKEDTVATSMLPALLKGTYFAAGFENGVPVYYLTRLVRAGGEIKQLDPKFIPESAHYLTDANGKQYKLTVGTDGTLSAVAVE